MIKFEEIRGNCIIEPGDKANTEHWLWQGANRGTHNGEMRTPAVWAPDYTVKPGERVMRVQSVARALIHMKTHAPIKKGFTPYRVCDVVGCVNPECHRLLSVKGWAAYCKRTGLLKRRHNYSVSNKKTWDTRGRKVSDEVVLQLTSSERKAREHAEELGIAVCTVNNIRRGHSRQAARMGMFSSLLR